METKRQPQMAVKAYGGGSGMMRGSHPAYQLSGGPPPAASYLLQEDGVSRFILEDGSGFILLE